MLQILGEKYRGHTATSNLGHDGVMLTECFAKLFQKNIRRHGHVTLAKVNAL